MNPAPQIAFPEPQAPGPEPRELAKASELGFAKVYENHVRFVWRTLRRLGVPDDDCDDAVQDVFVIVHRRLGDFRPDAPVKHWLFRLATGIARDHRRARRRKDPREHGLIPVASDEEVADAHAPGPAESAERSAAARLIRKLLLELDAAKREVFVLADLEQMTAPEIAEVLEVPLNTVYSRLRRARSEFEEALMRYRGRQRPESGHE
jgi:RNA polymerase sigma-70 factor (ECF subfamily)